MLSIYSYQNTKHSQTFFIFHYTELCTAAYLDKWGWKALPFPFENHVNGKMDKVPLVCRLMEEEAGRPVVAYRHSWLDDLALVPKSKASITVKWKDQLFMTT